VQPFFIFFQFFAAAAVNNIPINRRDNKRLREIQVVVHLVKSVDSSGTAAGNHRGGGFEFNVQTGKEKPVKKTFKITGNTAIINRGTDYDTFGPAYFFRGAVYQIIAKSTFAQFTALSAIDTSAYIFFSHLNYFGLYSFTPQFPRHKIKRPLYNSVIVRTAVKSDYFHR
jgi:hypothetical protein